MSGTSSGMEPDKMVMYLLQCHIRTVFLIHPPRSKEENCGGFCKIYILLAEQFLEYQRK